MLQCQPVQKLHGDEGLSVLVVNFVDGADVGVIQGGSGLRLSLEACKSLRIFGNLVGQELESHKAPEFDILSLVHDTHPTTAELLDDAVVRDGLADELGWSDH